MATRPQWTLARTIINQNIINWATNSFKASGSDNIFPALFFNMCKDLG